jgi:hypothetical protein
MMKSDNGDAIRAGNDTKRMFEIKKNQINPLDQGFLTDGYWNAFW